ncbi:SET domain-containing protein-lysine N-methyltransferase [Chlamydia gallinacea 08-1274/3]|uniref:SET domain-containing protein-lysine N-methyltransferase n=1 Tax=Chlamydia gallinacea 08-1274/3 TaxID=1143323 RepID=A0A173DYF5_9CHLA|nr:SET domain-containing protein [Chlamydia gallinacea]ANG65953.1 SET domain-containing protein-lysine N-methyltransferase [Chlamydia gallinacea 08-1274/3]
MKTIYISLNHHWKESSPYTMQRACQLLNFQFLPYLTFKSWQVEAHVRKLCRKAQKKHSISPLAKWLGELHKRDLITPPMPPIAICWINAYIGYGVFARERIPAWTYIGEYTGILRYRQAIWLDENDYCFRYPLSPGFWKYFTIDSGSQGNFTRFINHSDQPNVEAIGVFQDGLFHIIIRTMQTIEAGEELCYHYGPLYWKHRRKRAEFIPEEE